MVGKGHGEFIEHACEGFKDDDELALSARDRVTTLVNGSEADLEGANCELRDGFFSRRRNRVVVSLTLMMVSVVLVIVYMHGFARQSFHGVGDMFYEEGLGLGPIEAGYSHLSEGDKFILFGDPDASTPLEVAESRLEREPGNASYYVEYVQVCKSEKGKYPEDMVEYGDRFDAENSLYRLCVVGNAVRDKVVMNEREIDPYENESNEERVERMKKEREVREEKRKDRMKQRRRDREEGSEGSKHESAASVKQGRALAKPQMVIRDEGKFNHALELLYEAADKKVCTEHLDVLMKERVPLLNKEAKSLSEHMVPFLIIMSTPSPAFHMLRSTDIIIAEAQRCGREKDVEGLKRLMEMHEKIVKQMASEENVTLVYALVARAYITGVIPDFRDAAAACDLPELEKKYVDLIDVFDKEEALREAATSSIDYMDLEKYGSFISRMTLALLTSKIRDQSVISPLNHEPLRRVEHSIFSRFAVTFGWLFCLVLAGVFWVANRYKTRLSRGIAKKMVGVLGLRDWLLVLLVGMIVPLVIFYCVDRFSAWQITAYNVVYSEVQNSVLRVVSLLLILLCSQVLVLEWRLGRVTGRVFGRQNVWLVWVALILAVVPIFMVNTFENSSDFLKCWAMVGMGFFLLMTLIFMRYLPGLHSFKNAVVSRAFVMSLVMTGTVLSLMLPVYEAEERYWVGKDELIKLSPDMASPTRLEGEVTAQFVRETRALMGW